MVSKQPLQGNVQLSEQEREQGILAKVKKKIDFDEWGAATGQDPNKFVEGINQGTFDGPFGFSSAADPDEVVDYMRREYVKKITSEEFLQDYRDAGEVDDEAEATINQLRDEYDIDKSPVDLGVQAAGDAFKGVVVWVGSTSQALQNEGTRNQLLDEVGGSFTDAGTNVPQFLDALATLSADALADELPTGLFAASKDITTTLQGGESARLTDFNFNNVKQGFGGQSVEDLKKAQPLANFIAYIVPYALQGVRGGLLKTPSKIGALKAVGGELALDVGTSSVNQVEGDLLRERNKNRALNAATTVVATLGFESLGALGRNVLKKMKAGATKAEAIQQVQKELAEAADDITTGKKPVDIADVDAKLERYIIPVDDIEAKPDQFKVVGTKSAKVSAETFQKSLSAESKKLADIKNKYNQVKAKVSAMTGQADEVDAQLALVDKMKQQQKVVDDLQTKLDRTSKHSSKKTEYKRTSDQLNQAKAEFKETRNLYDDLLNSRKKAFSVAEPDDMVNPTTKRSSIPAEQAARPQAGQRYEQIKGRSDKAVSRWAAPEKQAEVKAANAVADTQAVQETKKVLGNDAAAETLHVDQPVMDGEFADRITAIGMKLGIVSYGQMRQSGTKRMADISLERAVNMNISNGIIQGASTASNNVYKNLATDLKMPLKKVQQNYLESGLYRSWVEGTTPDSALKPIELQAFQNLKKADATFNAENLRIMEEDLGIDTSKFNIEAFTDSSEGSKVITIDLTNKPELKADVVKAGYKTIELKPTAKVPDMPTREYVVIKYADSKKGVVQHLDQGRHYYEKKAPFLYDKDGKLLENLLQEEHNVSQTLFALEKESKLNPEQLTQIKGNLLEQGYDPADIKELLVDIAEGNTANVRPRVQKLYLGSLQRKEGALIGVNLDPINARRKQRIKLGKKVVYDKMNPVLDDMQKKIDQRLAAGSNTLTDVQRSKLLLEKKAIEFVRTDINGRPGPIEKMILDGIDAAGTLVGKPQASRVVYRGIRNLSEAILSTEVVNKLSLNLNASVLNGVEALRLNADTVIPDAAWTKIQNDSLDPVKFVLNAEQKMGQSTKYGNLYLDMVADGAIDSRFTNTGGGPLKTASKLYTQNRAAKVVMTPFTTSMRWGKAWTYTMGEALADSKGLKGVAKEDFLFDYMTNKRQVQVMNTSPLVSSDTWVKGLMTLKTFAHNMTEYEITQGYRVAVSHLKGKPDPQAWRAFSIFTGGSVAAFGLKGSPVLGLLLDGYGAGAEFTEWAMAQAGYDVDLPTFDEVEAESPRFSLGGFATRGTFSELTGVSAKQARVELVSTLSQTPLLVSNVLTNGASTLFETFANAAMAARAKDPQLFQTLTMESFARFLAKEYPTWNKANKTSDILFRGEVRSGGGNLIDAGINPKDRPIRALGAMVGWNPTEVDAKYAGIETNKKYLDLLVDQKRHYLDSAASLLNRGMPKQAEKVLRIAADMGFDISDETIETAILKKKLPQDTLMVQGLTDEETVKLMKKSPNFVKNANAESKQMQQNPATTEDDIEFDALMNEPAVDDKYQQE